MDVTMIQWVGMVLLRRGVALPMGSAWAVLAAVPLEWHRGLG